MEVAGGRKQELGLQGRLQRRILLLHQEPSSSGILEGNKGKLLAESRVLALENHNFALEGIQLVEDVLDALLLSHDFFLFGTCCGWNLG